VPRDDPATDCERMRNAAEGLEGSASRWFESSRPTWVTGARTGVETYAFHGRTLQSGWRFLSVGPPTPL
jgi:hypothetical protein